MSDFSFPIKWVRQCFPALNNGENFVFFDNGAGAQVPQSVLDTVRNHLVLHNVQRGGRYRKSQEVDAAIQHARETVATFLNAREASEVAFGMNATSFIRIVSLALAEILGDRKEIVVTDMDHEANIATWMALQSRGAVIRWWKMRENGTLHVEDLEPLLSEHTRLVACAVASNALGSIVDVKQVARLAHAAGAEVFLDAVHFAPHGVIDVQEWDCDYLVCSGYKIFAPHMGFLWGKRHLLEKLPTFREDFIPDEVPTKIEVGTFVYENVAGMDAAIAYLSDLGQKLNGKPGSGLRGQVVTAMQGIREYEAQLATEAIAALARIAGLTVYGVKDESQVQHRVPTICFTVNGKSAADVADYCAKHGVGVRDGNMYSPRLLKRMGISPSAGAVRASLVHYNTSDEIAKLASLLQQLAVN